MMILILHLFIIYDPLPDAYFMNPADTRLGIVVTDNHCSAIFLVHDNIIDKLFSAAGCGQYFTTSAEANKVGLKVISENGLQTPAVLDLPSGKITVLHEPVLRAGQVNFSKIGKTAFTIGTDLLVSDGRTIARYDLGGYANLAPISPDGNFAVYNDDHDQLWLLDLQSGKKERITDQKCGYCYPIWSPDSRLIAFSTLSGEISTYQLSDKQTFEIGPGRNPDWSPDSRYIIYHILETDGRQLLNSDLYLSSYDGSEQTRLTATKDIMEMDAAYISGSEIVYHTYDRRELIRRSIVAARLGDMQVIATLPAGRIAERPAVRPDFGPRDSIDVPYLNQVYDTPDWHNGHWSCAPTAAMMAIAYYRKLPHWDCWCSQPSGHESHFGNYICAEYNYREQVYDLVAQDAGGNNAWGGYGYMWYNGYSPYSRMMNYLQDHDLNTWSDDSPTWAETSAEVQAGWPYCMCVGLTTAGHLILAVGQVLDWHTLIFNDPYGNKNLPGYPNYYGKYSRYDWPGYNNGYENLNEVYWCRGARGGWEPAPDTLVDDLQYQYPGEAAGFYIFNDPPSTQRYFHDLLAGYNGHMWWTYTTNSTDTCYVTWTPVLASAGNYEVFAYIPGSLSNADARYQIHYQGGAQTVVVDQSSYPDQWVSLGTYPFNPSGGYVYLGDATGTAGQHITFDAMRWHFVPGGIEEKLASADNPPCFSSVFVKNELVLTFSDQNCRGINYSVYDITGQLILEGLTSAPGTDQPVNINTSRLSTGVYILKVIVLDRGKEFTKKFTKLN